ncbi:hypothetical protein [Paenibacillus phytorum]|nr:hypothetical protein [Paenibacillus phytorum]
MPIEHYWHVFKDKPYEEVFSLSGSMYFEDDEDSLVLIEDFGQKNHIRRDFFSVNLPFVFAPNDLSLGLGDETRIQHFEEILSNDAFKTNLLKRMITGEKVENYKPLNWFFGKGWDPRKVPWKEFEEQMDDWFVKYKMMYRDRTENLLEQQGYIKSKEKRNLEHFEWLVRFQVQCWSLKEIADYYSEESNEILSEDTISRGIKSTAELIYLILRPGNKPGRPKTVV